MDTQVRDCMNSVTFYQPLTKGLVLGFTIFDTHADYKRWIRKQTQMPGMRSKSLACYTYHDYRKDGVFPKSGEWGHIYLSRDWLGSDTLGHELTHFTIHWIAGHPHIGNKREEWLAGKVDEAFILVAMKQ
jgi:hypothetical protein